ncbi:MerR family transcriptional regulator [Sneathiella aquimaris]|uniref:MerR family transcriptional regulator n=1 Tax=Sneathiella aquimaris TaxID=2599305 RepID=UPI00146DA650|nr:MerR family transcriptional regulator [Sneathiella aquimaris]
MSDIQNTVGGKSSKSPDAFRTISEVSDELDVPQHVLRFWESKFPVVKPLKRGGGRRYYRPADVELIRGIRDLLYTHGFTIKGAQKLLKEQGGKIENIDVLSPVSKKQDRQAEAPVITASSGNGLNAAADDTAISDHRELLENILTELKELKQILNN